MSDWVWGYHWSAVVIAAALAVPAWLIAATRSSLLVFSRRLLLEKVPVDRREAIEERISYREEFLLSLGLPAQAIRLLIVVVLAWGRVLHIDAMLADDGGFRSLGMGPLLLAGAVFFLEIFAADVILLRFSAAVVAQAVAERWVLRVLRLLEGLEHVDAPVRARLERVARLFGALFGASVERKNADIVEDDIRTAVEEGQREGLLGTRDLDMIESIMEYGSVEVSEVMTPRTEMVTLELEQPLAANLERVVECGHSRIPVHDGGKDQIVGILYVKDLQRDLLRGTPIDIAKIMREPYFVSERTPISDLLQDFKRHRRHLAIVQDDHGGTAGLVTIEDILEEIVGDLGDEDDDDQSIRRLDASVVEVDGSVHIDDLNDRVGTDLPEGETYDTVGGYVFERLGHVPAVGDSHHYDGVRFEILEADERRVHRLRLHLPPSDSAAAESAAAP